MAKEPEEKKEEEKQKGRYELVEVPTQAAIVVKDNQTEAVFQQEQVMLEILNKLDNIEKNTG